MIYPKNGYFATNTALVRQPDSTSRMNTVRIDNYRYSFGPMTLCG